MNKPFFTIQNEAGIPSIHITGQIGKDVDYVGFRNALVTLLSSGAKRVKLIVNSIGGNMAEGFAIYDYIRSLGLTIEGEIIGMAASMGGVIVQCASKGLLGMHENALLMTHRPQSQSTGESDTHRANADLQDKLEVKAKQIFINRGASEDSMKDWFKPGQMKWFTAEDALKEGIIDYIIKAKPGEAKPEQPANTFSNEVEAFQYYNSFIPKNNTEKPIIKMNKLLVSVVFMLNSAGITTVTMDSTEDEVTAALKTFNTENTATLLNLKNQLDATGKTRAKDLIANMKLAGKLPTDMDETTTAKWENRAEKDYDGMVDMFSMMGDASTTPVNTTVDFNKSLVQQGKVENKGADKTDRKNWTLLDYEQKDPTWVKNLMVSNAAEYSKMFEAEYGVKPF